MTDWMGILAQGIQGGMQGYQYDRQRRQEDEAQKAATEKARRDAIDDSMAFQSKGWYTPAEAQQRLAQLPEVLRGSLPGAEDLAGMRPNERGLVYLPALSAAEGEAGKLGATMAGQMITQGNQTHGGAITRENATHAAGLARDTHRINRDDDFRAFGELARDPNAPPGLIDKYGLTDPNHITPYQQATIDDRGASRRIAQGNLDLGRSRFDRDGQPEPLRTTPSQYLAAARAQNPGLPDVQIVRAAIEAMRRDGVVSPAFDPTTMLTGLQQTFNERRQQSAGMVPPARQ